jgi:hypothetical protein
MRSGFVVVCDDYRCPTVHRTHDAAVRAAERIDADGHCRRSHRVEAVGQAQAPDDSSHRSAPAPTMQHPSSS